MSRHTLYAYVDGSDLTDVAEPIERELQLFVDTEQWFGAPPIVINQRAPDSDTHGDDLPDWDLGLNLALPDPGAESTNWFRELEMIARHLGRLHARFYRDFVIGISDNVTGYVEDLFFVDSDIPDLSKLRAAIGTSVTSSTR